jgi:hypothetical protein
VDCLAVGVRERDEVVGDPVGVPEVPSVDPLADRLGHPRVDRQEHRPPVVPGVERLQELV